MCRGGGLQADLLVWSALAFDILTICLPALRQLAPLHTHLATKLGAPDGQSTREDCVTACCPAARRQWADST